MSNTVKNKVTRPSGWTGKMTDKYLLKSSTYGQKYFCTDCGKIALGTNFKDDSHHHYPSCKRLKV